jgi:hypothetical protein
MGVPHARKNEGAEAQALVVRGFRNPNPRKNGPTGEEKCSHDKKGGHSKEACWFLHPHLRPATRVDKGDQGRKGENVGHKGAQRRKEEATEKGLATGTRFSTLRVFDPVVTKLEDSNSHRSSGSINESGAEDQMQRIFKSFSMWYAQQNSDGLSLNSFKPNLHNLIILDSGATDHIFCDKKL